MKYTQTLTRYKAWANDLLFAALSRLPESDLIAPRPIVFGSVLRTLNHVHAMDQVWQAHLEGRPHGLSTRNPDTHPAFEELRSAQRQIDTWYIRYADSLPKQGHDQVVNFTFIGGGSGSMTRGDILLHVVNHATYHRGHIADMMYQIAARPPTTDLPVFLRDCNL
jgi:uncharacterized damage-inducible protein DinB